MPVTELKPGHALARRLLDGVEPIDAAAHQAIDDALRSKSNDPVLHAAALLVAYSAGTDLRLSRSHARGWAPGLHELVDSGHLDAAAAALPKLATAFPQLPYLDYMAFVFRQLPPAVTGSRRPFLDDRGKDVQTVMMPGVDTVIMAFCGATNQLGISTNVLDRWFARTGCHVVYLRDRRKIGYTGGIPVLGRDMAATVTGLNGIARDLDAHRIVCLGNSAGASGALRYARALGAARVLALAPITGGRKYAKLVAPHLPPGGVMPWGDLVPLYRGATGVRARIMYGADNAGDEQQSKRMAGLPGVTVEALPDWESHHLIGGLLRAGRLEDVLGWLVSEQDDADAALTSATRTQP